MDIVNTVGVFVFIWAVLVLSLASGRLRRRMFDLVTFLIHGNVIIPVIVIVAVVIVVVLLSYYCPLRRGNGRRQDCENFSR
jgi:uncharacterized membrane protein